MKRLTAVLSAFLMFVLLATAPALAQRGQRGMMARPDSLRGPMMGQGMMQMTQGGMMPMMHRMHRQMMQNPMHRSSMMAFMLPALADTLELSEEQTNQLKKLRSGLMERRQTHRQQMRAHRKELMSLFEDGSHPAPAEVRKHLRARAELRADRQAALYETAQQMRQVLTAAQRQMLDGMTSHQRMHQVMSHMTVMEMMQMRQTMRGGGMGNCTIGQMPNRPMMRGGMMQQGGMRQHMPRRQNRQNQ